MCATGRNVAEASWALPTTAGSAFAASKARRVEAPARRSGRAVITKRCPVPTAKVFCLLAVRLKIGAETMGQRRTASQTRWWWGSAGGVALSGAGAVRRVPNGRDAEEPYFAYPADLALVSVLQLSIRIKANYVTAGTAATTAITTHAGSQILTESAQN